MDEDGSASALDHLPRGYRRADAYGQKNEHLAARAHRPSARAMKSLYVDQSILLHEFDPARQVGVFEINSGFGPLFHVRADPLIDLHGRERKAFVSPARLDPEGIETPSFNQVP